jgi:hypothetical protein
MPPSPVDSFGFAFILCTRADLLYKVVVWGESAGAQSIAYHLFSYNGRDDGLFRAAIMESGGRS